MADGALKSKLQRETIWALLGILVTVILGLPAIYYTIHEKVPHIAYEIIGDTKVLDVHKPVKELEIRYKGEDIYAQKKNLSVLTITVRNDGETHIKQADFDTTTPWGLLVNNGHLVDAPKLIDANSDYIRSNINLSAGTNDTISFQKIIFEKDKYFTFELQILHRDEETPQIIPIGKIAGIEKQAVVKRYKSQGPIGFWASVFFGTWGVQVTRAAVFTIALVIVLFGIIATGSLLGGAAERARFRRRQLAIALLRSYAEPLLKTKEGADRKIATFFLLWSFGNFEKLTDLRMRADAERFRNTLLYNFQLPELEHYAGVSAGTWQMSMRRSRLILNIIFDGDKIRPNVRTILDETINFLKEHPLPPEVIEVLMQYRSSWLSKLAADSDFAFEE